MVSLEEDIVAVVVRERLVVTGLMRLWVRRVSEFMRAEDEDIRK